ncbi:MAG: FAD:protein FMN transferase [Thermoleophilia bacterium]|nr:FAD:protein FMN transferase [Thermoleophilia bacterium]
MGTSAMFLLRDDPGHADALFQQAETALLTIQARLSRFEPTSLLEQLNDRGHGVASGPLAQILRAAAAATAATSGRFDIGVGADLIAAGYDRSFDLLDKPDAEVRARGAALDTTAKSVEPYAPREPSFTIDDAGRVQLREGVRLDLGGIAKGWAADTIRARLARESGVSCLVNLGGDISVHVEPDDEPWPIGVSVGRTEHSIGIGFGGLATSGQDNRVWHAPDGDGLVHHIIDPRTRRSATTDVLRVTMIGESTMAAEVWAKALMLEGFVGAVAEADARGFTTIITPLNGDVGYTGAVSGLAGGE